MTTRAYAKINLGLRILLKRTDGYHDIETVFHQIDLFDEISFEPSSTVSLTCNSPHVPTDERNLCTRTAQLLQQSYNIRQGVSITLKKNIPVGAGLGGGSSDAAATLRALTKLWHLTVTEQELHSLALQLGSDVPYFLNNGTAYATGRGEVLEYFNLDIPYWIVVVYPNLHISTAWAYQQLNISRHARQPQLRQLLLEHINQPRMLMNLVQNDFEPLVLRAHESVAKVKQALYLTGAEFAEMSGSGSAVFSFFSSQLLARNTANELGKQYKVFITPPHFRPNPV